MVIPYTMGTIILRESFHRYTLAVLCLDCPSLGPRQWHPSRSQCYPGYVDMRSPINRLAWCRVNLVQGLPGTSCLSIFRVALQKYYNSNPALGRSARFGRAWSGGEVESATMVDSGMEATKLLRRPRRRLALYRMSHEVL